MGHPIRVSPEIKSELREMVETILKRGRIPEGDERAAIDSALKGLSEGFDVNVRILLDAVSEYGSIYERKRADEFGASIDVLKRTSGKFANSYKVVWEFDHSKFDDLKIEVDGFPSQGIVAQGAASKRAMTAPNPLRLDPYELITYVFEPFGSIVAAKETEADESGGTAFESLETEISGNIARQFLSVMKGESGDPVIPPPPTAAAFHELMRERLGPTGVNYDAWKGLDYWKLGVAFLFADLLVNGTVEADMSDVPPSERPEVLYTIQLEARERLRVWFKSLRHLFEMPQLESAVARWFEKKDDERTLALAELSRFGQLTGHRPWDNKNAPDVLFRNMLALHRTFPHIEGRRFAGLVAPLLRPFDFEGVKGFFKGLSDDPKGFNRFKARLIFLWHAGDHGHFISEIAKVISTNRSYETLEKFLSARLECTVRDFVVKLEGLKEKGADIAPVLEAVERKFPGSLSGLKYAAPLFEGMTSAAGDSRSVWDDVESAGPGRDQLSLRPIRPAADKSVRVIAHSHGDGQAKEDGIMGLKGSRSADADADPHEEAAASAAQASVAGGVQLALVFPSLKPVV